jgi:predicted kinase
VNRRNDEGRGIGALVIVCGLAGCGKTTLARSLSRTLHIPHIDYDTTTERFIRAIMERDGSSDFWSYAREFRATAYRTALDIAFESIAAGIDVIVSGPFGKESGDVDFFQRLRTRYAVPFFSVVLEIEVPEPLLKKRIQERGSDRDSQKLANWDAFMKAEGHKERLWKPDAFIRIDEAEESHIDDIVCEVRQKLMGLGLQ